MVSTVHTLSGETHLKFIVTALALLLAACQAESPDRTLDQRADASSGGKAPVASGGPLSGELHVGGNRHRVAPFVFHPHEMDLRVHGLVERDKARKEGRAVAPLAFDEDRRAAPPKKIRVEYKMGVRVADSLRVLNTQGEAAHFLVEPTGSIYQVLDLAHAARRDGELRRDEIRVMSGNTGGTDTLVAALSTYYGALSVERAEFPPLPPPPPASPSPSIAPPAPTRSTP